MSDETITREYVESEILTNEEIESQGVFRFNSRNLTDLAHFTPTQLSAYVSHAKALVEELNIADDPRYSYFARRLNLFDQGEKNDRLTLARIKSMYPD